MESSAKFSEDRTYRYNLRRTWDPTKAPAVFVALNPSTADETQDDPTIRRCIGFARSWGAGSIVMLNAFALRATDPRDMKLAADPVGPANDHELYHWAYFASVVVACWGVHGEHLGRGTAVRELLQRAANDRSAVRSDASRLKVFGLTKDGHPKHPLYLAKTTQLESW